MEFIFCGCFVIIELTKGNLNWQEVVTVMKRQTTKEILAQSFLELAEKKRIDKITIAEITANCGMSQPTFYNHFRDKYDLIIWIYVEDAKRFTEKVGEGSYAWRDGLRDAAQYYAAKRNFVINALLHTSGHDSFINQMQRAHVDIFVKAVRKKLLSERIPEEIMGVIKIYCYGTVQYMFEWLLDDMKIPPEKMVEIWEQSLPEPLKAYLYDE